MRITMHWLVAGWMLCAGMATGQGTESRFFRIVAPEQIDITGISDGVITWDQPVGIEVTVEISENLADPSGWRRHTAIPGDETRGSVRVFDRDTPHGMVLIPGGTNEGTDPDFTYSLTVESFYMDATPVTKAQWDEVYNWATHSDRGENIYTFDNEGLGKAANHPVVEVSWYDVVKWCNARSEKEGRTPVYTVSGNVYRTGSFGWNGSVVNCDFNANGYRLPTVTEHQYASRGGLVGKRFPWGDTITHSHANYQTSYSDSYDTSPTRGYHPSYNDGTMPYTSPVGSFAANGYGLYDMAGNVWEWCWDPWDLNRNIRGGCWFSNAFFLRCGGMLSGPPDDVLFIHGFRAVCR